MISAEDADDEQQKLFSRSLVVFCICLLKWTHALHAWTMENVVPLSGIEIKGRGLGVPVFSLSLSSSLTVFLLQFLSCCFCFVRPLLRMLWIFSFCLLEG